MGFALITYIGRYAIKQNKTKPNHFSGDHRQFAMSKARVSQMLQACLENLYHPIVDGTIFFFTFTQDNTPRENLG